MSQLGETIRSTGNAVLWFTERQLEGVKPDHFARQPTMDGRRVDTNHPAFVLGHLAIYPRRLADMCGIASDATAAPEGWEDLFSPKAECRDDPDGSIYPPMAEITDGYFRTYRALLDGIAEVSHEVFGQTNPNERMRDMFPTVGDMGAFMVGAHTMSHLGQFSAWRRCMGLGRAW